jgi:hypothetical protein
MNLAGRGAEARKLVAGRCVSALRSKPADFAPFLLLDQPRGKLKDGRYGENMFDV